MSIKKAGEDFTDISGTLEFQPGETIEFYMVDIIWDTDPEEDEVFGSLIKNANVPITVNDSLARILNDDNQKVYVLAVYDRCLNKRTAAAFAMSREYITDSLAGVAISISLAPPLCVVGIALSDGQCEVRRVGAKDDKVTVQIAGEGEPPQTADLVSAVQDKAQHPVTLEIESDSLEIEPVDVLPTGE